MSSPPSAGAVTASHHWQRCTRSTDWWQSFFEFESGGMGWPRPSDYLRAWPRVVIGSRASNPVEPECFFRSSSVTIETRQICGIDPLDRATVAKLGPGEEFIGSQ